MGRQLDQLVVLLASRARFQTLVLVLAGFNYLPLVFNHIIMAFYGATPPHHCSVTQAGTGGDNSSGAVNSNGDTVPDSYMYHNESVVMEVGEQCVTHLQLASGVNTTITCPRGAWVYAPQYRERTIVSEWDLVCGGRDLVSLATTIYFVGVMLGGLLFGYLSDMLGRRPILLLTLYLPVGVGVGVAFANSYLLFVILRFVQGVLMQGLQTSSYILAMEFFVPSRRPLVGAVMECFWGSAVMLLAGMAYLLPYWRHLQLAVSLPSVLALFYICVMPESLRWLLMKGRMDEAEKLVARMARVNRLPFPQELWDTVRKESCEGQRSTQQYHFIHLFRTPMLRRRTLVLFYVWLTIATCYYGLIFKITSLPGNKYLIFFIGGLVEFVAYVCSLYVMGRFGRKKPLFVCFLSAGVCCIVSASIPQITTESGFQLEHISTVFAIIGRFFMGGLFSVIFVYTTKLYPTVIRNIGMGTCLFWARLGGVIAPQINRLGVGSVILVPILVFGVMMLLAATLLLLLPETHGCKLPDSINDIEHPQSDTNGTLGTIEGVEQQLMEKGTGQSHLANGDADQAYHLGDA